MPSMQPGGPIAPAPPVMDQTMMMMPQSASQSEDEPPNKKLRSEDHLIPENQFITMHKVCHSLTLSKIILIFDIFFIHAFLKISNQDFVQD